MKQNKYGRTQPPAGGMNTPTSKLGEAAPMPVFPQTRHRLRPPKAAASPAAPKRDNIFSKSRDTREDRGIREIKTSRNDRTVHAR
jgi:hypothetical protein